MVKSCAETASKNVKYWIKRRGYTQAEFAELVSYEERTVRRWLHEGINNLNVLEYIADVLGVEVVTLLSDDDDVTSFLGKIASYFHFLQKLTIKSRLNDNRTYLIGGYENVLHNLLRACRTTNERASTNQESERDGDTYGGSVF